MKFYESKVAKFIAGKGFYAVLALCMAVIGVAAYSAMEKSDPEPFADQSIYSEDNDSVIIPSYPNNEPDVNVQNNDDISQSEQATDVTDEANPPIFTIPVEGTVLKNFSKDTLVYSETFKDMRVHTGVDIVPLYENVVVSAFSGTVIGIEENTVYSTVVTIDHGDGVILSYCGLTNLTIKSGDTVDSQEVIGEIGTVASESADKPHLHLELMLNGEYADPLTLFNEE